MYDFAVIRPRKGPSTIMKMMISPSQKEERMEDVDELICSKNLMSYMPIYFHKCANMLLSYVIEYGKSQESDLENREKESISSDTILNSLHELCHWITLGPM